MSFLVVTPKTRADGVRTGGGGSHVASEFVNVATVMRDAFQSRIEDLPKWFNLDKFSESISEEKGALVIPVVELEIPEDAKLEKGIFIDAYFTRPTEKKPRGNIQLVFAQLEKTVADPLRYTSFCHLILHEYLGIMGDESHGEYARSAELLQLARAPLQKKFATWKIKLEKTENLLKGEMIKGIEFEGAIQNSIDRNLRDLHERFPSGLNWIGYSFGGKGQVEWMRTQNEKRAIVTIAPEMVIENVVDALQFGQFQIEFKISKEGGKEKAAIEVYQSSVINSFPLLEIKVDDPSRVWTNLKQTICLTRMFSGVLGMVPASEDDANLGPTTLAKLLGGGDRNLEEFIARTLVLIKSQAKDEQTIKTHIRMKLHEFPVSMVLPLEFEL